MCGICGFFHKDPDRNVAPDVIDKMTDAMFTRGPDGRGTFAAHNNALGHRRLSIIDLAGGQQPMHHTHAQSTITFNGEIYNYIELQKQYLQGRFDQAGDTRILLHLLQTHKTEILPKLNGMFAFAFWDRDNQQVLLARDPAGQKPLFYYWSQTSFVFASSLNSLTHHPDVKHEFDIDTLPYYLFYESYLHPHSPLKNVYKVPPGHVLTLDLKTWHLNLSPFWENPLKQISRSESDALEIFESTFQNAVERHMRSDVDVGIFLSGGLDSPSLVKAASTLRAPSQLKTFTIRHEQDSFNEADQAREIASHYGTNHHERLLKGVDFQNDVQRVLSHMDEPISDPGFLAIYEVVKFSREHVKVILSGNGGDEFWAGYAPFQALRAYQNLNTWMPSKMLPLLRYLAHKLPASHAYMNHGFKIQRFLRGVHTSPAEVLQNWISAFSPTEMGALLASDQSPTALSRHPKWHVSHIQVPLYEAYDKLQETDLVSVLCNAFQQFFLPSCICNHADKSSMMESQELRSPYLDLEMMQLANSMPSQLKYHQGQTKYLMRQYLKTNAPSHVSQRPKRGFTVPIASWLTTALKDWGETLLSPALIKADGIFNPETVQNLWQAHQKKQANHAKALWTLIVFQHWYHTNFKSWKN